MLYENEYLRGTSALEYAEYKEAIKPLLEQLKMLEENPPKIEEGEELFVWEKAIREGK